MVSEGCARVKHATRDVCYDARVARLRALAIAAVLLAGGCRDVVIGTFAATGGEAGEGGGSSSSGGVTSPLPGGCIEQDFEAPLDTTVFWPWNEDDAAVADVGGVLTLTPPSTAEQGVGLILEDDLAFAYTSGRISVEIVTPPDPDSDSELFLQVLQHVPMSQAMASLGLYRGQVRAGLVRDDGSYALSGPVAETIPRFVAVRAEAGTIFFESSDDGQSWTTLRSGEAPTDFVGAVPLLMVWNNPGAGVPAPQPVVLDNFSICAD